MAIINGEIELTLYATLDADVFRIPFHGSRVYTIVGFHASDYVEESVHDSYWYAISTTNRYEQQGANTYVYATGELISIDPDWNEGVGDLSERLIAILVDYPNNMNLSPVAKDDIFIATENTAISGNVLLNNGSGPDYDLDGDSLTVVAATLNTAHGAVVITENGGFTYTPTSDFVGNETFLYEIQDGRGHNDFGQVALTFKAAPVAKQDNFSVNEDNNLVGNLLGDNGFGSDTTSYSDALKTIAKTALTAHGSVIIGENGTFLYIPTANYYGTDSFSYEIDDGHGGTDEGLVNITVNSVNDLPVTQDTYFSIFEETILNGNVLGLGSDIDGDSLSVQPATLTSTKGNTVVVQSDGSFVYTPQEDFYGQDSFKFTLLDGFGGSDIGKVTILVKDVAEHKYGSDADENFVGGYQNDFFAGGGGSDKIYGGRGQDELWGNEGDDILYGGASVDWMKGGNGADLFILDTGGEKPDIIADLRINKGDTIQVRDILDFDPITDAITDFIKITESGGNSLLSVDIDGVLNGSHFAAIGKILGVTGLDVNTLYAGGDLIVQHAIT